MKAEPAPRGRSVLNVEDDPRTRAALVSVLTLMGFHTVSVASVAQGLEKLDGQHFAILDLNLPDGLGTHVLKRIRDEKRSIRVAVVTGASDAAQLAAARALGPELFLQKPVDLDALLNWLNSAD